MEWSIKFALTHSHSDERIWDLVEDFVVVISLGGKCFEMSWGKWKWEIPRKLWENRHMDYVGERNPKG